MKSEKSTKPTMTAKEFENYRKSLSFDQHTMADVIGVTYQAIRLWELGQRKIPETTVRLVKLFKKFPQLVKEF